MHVIHRLSAAFPGVMAALTLAVLLGGAPGCVNETTRHNTGAAVADDPSFDANGSKPANASTLHALARILATQGRDVECERMLTQIIESEPDYLPAYSDLAELHMRRNRIGDAIATISVGLGRAPGDAVLLNNLGMCRLLSDDYEGALASFTQASEAAPKDESYLSNKAMALGMLGRYDEAAALYRRILDSPADVNHNLAVLRRAREHAAPTTAPAIVEPPVTR